MEIYIGNMSTEKVVALLALVLTIISYALYFIVYMHPMFRRSPYHAVLYMNGKEKDPHHPSVFAFVVSLNFIISLLIAFGIISMIDSFEDDIDWIKLALYTGVEYVVVFYCNNLYAKKKFGYKLFEPLELKLFIEEYRKVSKNSKSVDLNMLIDEYKESIKKSKGDG